MVCSLRFSPLPQRTCSTEKRRKRVSRLERAKTLLARILSSCVRTPSAGGAGEGALATPTLVSEFPLDTTRLAQCPGTVRKFSQFSIASAGRWQKTDVLVVTARRRLW